ncbi:GYD domain-containing protein [bacterium]|nr:GYD domain-containing protein [bacterium]
MATFIMFGKYSLEAIEKISAKRTEKAVGLIRELGGEVKSMFVLLGKNDLLFIVDLPGTEQALKASVALSKMAGILVTTSPAMSVEEFDKLVKV